VNLQSITKDKRLLAGVGVAAAVGLFVFLRKGGAAGVAGSGSDEEGGTSVGSGVGYLGGYDSVSADIAAQLGQYGAGTQAQLDEFAGTLQDALEKMTGDGTTTTPTTPPPADTKDQTDKTDPKKTTTKKYVTVGKWKKSGAPWNSTLSGIAKKYNTSVAKLLKLNPGIKNKNVIYPGQKVRVK